MTLGSAMVFGLKSSFATLLTDEASWKVFRAMEEMPEVPSDEQTVKILQDTQSKFCKKLSGNSKSSVEGDVSHNSESEGDS